MDDVTKFVVEKAVEQMVMLTERIQELELALMPFSEVYGDMSDETVDEDKVSVVTMPDGGFEMRVRDFRMAAKALNPDWYQGT